MLNELRSLECNIVSHVASVCGIDDLNAATVEELRHIVAGVDGCEALWAAKLSSFGSGLVKLFQDRDRLKAKIKTLGDDVA